MNSGELVSDPISLVFTAIVQTIYQWSASLNSKDLIDLNKITIEIHFCLELIEFGFKIRIHCAIAEQPFGKHMKVAIEPFL